MKQKKTVLIAGGSGLIGSSISDLLKENGFEVYILSRKMVNKNDYVLWNPKQNVFQWNTNKTIDLLINLCGEGIADKRWTKSRKKELEFSRIEATNFLFQKTKEININHYIGASGITAYPFNTNKIYTERDRIQGNYIQKLVEKWEDVHNKFKTKTKTTILRIAPVIKPNFGIMYKMNQFIKFGLGSYLGNGNQFTPWVHYKDLSRMFLYVYQNKLEGIFNTNNSNCTNKELTDAIAFLSNKKIILPNIPKFVLKVMLGEMSEMILGSLKTSSQKIKNTGFEFQYKEITKVF